MKNGAAAVEKLGSFPKSQTQLPHDPGISLLDMYPRKMKTYVRTAKTAHERSERHYSQRPQSGNNPPVHRLTNRDFKMRSFMHWNSTRRPKGWRTDPRYNKSEPGQHYAKWKQSVSHRGPRAAWVHGRETSRSKAQRQDADRWGRRAEWRDCEKAGGCEQVWADDTR